MNAGEAWGDCAAAGVGKQEARGGSKVAVEALEEAEEGHDENELDGPVLAETVFESDVGCETFAQKGLPRRDIGDRDDRERIEEGTNSESQADGLHVACLAEVWVGLFRVFRDGFETRHEIRNDL